MANRSVITSRGLQLLSKASAAGENSYWIGYYGLAYVPEENRGEHGEDYLTSSTDVLTKTGDYIYNVWQGSMTPTGFNTETSAAGDLYNKCLYTSNIMARYRYVLDENGKNNLVMWRGTTDSSSYKLTGGAVYRGVGAEGEDGQIVTQSQMPIPAPLFYLGEPTRYDTPLDEAGLVDAVKYPNVSEDYPVFDNLPSVSTDSRDYSASSKLTENPPSVSDGGFGDYGSMSGATKYEWAAASKTFTQDQDAQDDAPISEDANRYCQQYWKYQSISNFNRFHAPASAEGFSVDYEPACRNMAKATKYFPISYYKVLNVEQGKSETGSTDVASTTATSLQLTVDLNLRDYNNIVANRTNTAEIVVEPGHESGIKDMDGNDLYESRQTSLKFNRIGIYAVPMTIHRFTTEDEKTGVCDSSKVQFEIMGDAEPVLFAVADVDEVMVKEGGAIDKWSIEFVLNLTDATDEGAILRDTSIFYNMYEDDAITWYKNQLLATASLSESVINQGIEINYLRNQIANLEGNGGDCFIESGDDEWARKNHTHPYMKNIVDSMGDGNGAVRGIYTQAENDSITVYNTVGHDFQSDDFRVNGTDYNFANYGFYRMSSSPRLVARTTMSDVCALAVLKRLGVDEFKRVFNLNEGYVTCSDPNKDFGTVLSGDYTKYDESHLYIRVSVESDENKLGVIVIDRGTGSYVLYKNSEISTLPNSSLNPQYQVMTSYTYGMMPTDVLFTMPNFLTGDYSMTLGKNSASGGKYNLNLSANGILNTDSHYNLLMGGSDTDEPNSVRHISVSASDHNIIMGNALSSQIANASNSLMMIAGEGNLIGNALQDSFEGHVRSSMLVLSNDNRIHDLNHVIGVLDSENNVTTSTNSLLLSPGKVRNAVNSIVIGASPRDVYADHNLSNAYASILVNTGDYGTNANIGTSILINSGDTRLFNDYTYNNVAKALNNGVDVNRSAQQSIMLGYSYQYGNMTNVIAHSYSTIGNLNPHEMIPMDGGSDVNPRFWGGVNNALLFGGTANGMTDGILGVGQNVYFPSNSKGVMEIGDCSIDTTQRPNVNFTTVDEMNEQFGSQAPADGKWDGYSSVIFGTGELNLAKGDGTTFTKSVRGISLYVTYNKNSKSWSDGCDLDHDDWRYYSKNVISPSDWSNLLFIGAGANAGAGTTNSVFIGKNSAWAKTTFVNSFINTLGSDGGAKYTKYTNPGSGSGLIAIPPTRFENVWWIGHNSNGHESEGGTGRDDSTKGAFSVPVALASLFQDNQAYPNLPKYSIPVFKDTFAFVGSNPNLFNHAYWYGVDTTWKDSVEKMCQPAKTPMIYTGGIALGGVGSDDANFGMLKLGCARTEVSAQADLYKDYVNSLVTYKTSVYETDPIQLIPCTYAGVTRQCMHSPHAGKCLVVQDLQELDGTLHIGLGYPTDTFGNAIGDLRTYQTFVNISSCYCHYMGYDAEQTSDDQTYKGLLGVCLYIGCSDELDMSSAYGANDSVVMSTCSYVIGSPAVSSDHYGHEEIQNKHSGSHTSNKVYSGVWTDCGTIKNVASLVVTGSGDSASRSLASRISLTPKHATIYNFDAYNGFGETGFTNHFEVDIMSPTEEGVEFILIIDNRNQHTTTELTYTPLGYSGVGTGGGGGDGHLIADAINHLRTSTSESIAAYRFISKKSMIGRRHKQFTGNPTAKWIYGWVCEELSVAATEENDSLPLDLSRNIAH